jgi:hypothetical protein
LDTIGPPINRENSQLYPYPSSTALQSNGDLCNASFMTSPSDSSVAVTPFFPPSVDRIGTVSRSRSGAVTAKGRKSFLGFMTDSLISHKREEPSTPYDPVHLTHVGFNSSAGEFTGLPKEWQQLIRDSGISKSDLEKNPLAVMEIVKFYQEGGGDVWDKMGYAPAPGDSQSSPIPGTVRPEDIFVSTVSVSTIPRSRILTVRAAGVIASEKGPLLRRPIWSFHASPTSIISPCAFFIAACAT